MRRAVAKILPRTGQKEDASPSGLLKIDFNSVDEFYIMLEKPHTTWLPGEEVSGQVILVLKKNLANITITLSLVGYVKIRSSSHTKLRPVKHTLFNHCITIFGGDATSSDELSNGLYKGEHRFPFIVKLPNKRVFTSIDFGKGSIVYLLRAAINGPNSASSTPNSPSTQSPNIRSKYLKGLHGPYYTSEKNINIVSPIDVAKLPPAKPKKLIIRDPRYTKKLSRTQSSASTINTFVSASSNNSDSSNIQDAESPAVTIQTNSDKPESIKVSLEIPERGYLRGEQIPVKLNINHLKKLQDVNGIIVTLLRVCRLNGGGEGMFESFRKDLQQTVVPLYVDPNTFQSLISTSVRVPADAFPSIIGCPLISFQYFIEVLVNLSGKSVSLESNEHGSPSLVKTEETSDILNMQSANENLKFNFNVAKLINQTERSSFVNTDRFKRMKKFAQITTEVIIGTHRLAANNASNTTHLSIGVPFSRRSSVVSASNASPSGLSTSSSPNNEASPLRANYETGEVPPYHDNVPNYHEVVPAAVPAAVPAPVQPEMTEKERIRAYESSLLPSAPQFDDDDESSHDYETISPLGQNGVLESVEEESSPLPQEDPYQFFSVPGQSNQETTGATETT